MEPAGAVRVQNGSLLAYWKGAQLTTGTAIVRYSAVVQDANDSSNGFSLESGSGINPLVLVIGLVVVGGALYYLFQSRGKNK